MGEIISQSSRTRNSRRKSPKKHTPMFLKRITPHVLCVIEVSQKRLAIVVTSELERWGCKHEMNTFWLYINNNHTSTFGRREFVENAEYVRESQRPILDMLFISRKCQLSALQKKKQIHQVPNIFLQLCHVSHPLLGANAANIPSYFNCIKSSWTTLWGELASKERLQNPGYPRIY